MTSRVKRSLARALACLAFPAFLFVPCAAFATGLASDWAEGHNSRARLIAGNGVAGVELQMPEGWKTYWRNPGDAGGVPPSFDWSKSDNLASADVLYPAPHRLTDRAGDTVGYKGTVVFPVRLSAKDPKKPIDLHLTLDYGICKDVCIPTEAALTLAIDPAHIADPSPELAAALERVPTPAGDPDGPALKRVESDLTEPKPRIVLHTFYPKGTANADLFVEAPPGLYVPLPKKVADDGAGNATFEIDLSDGVDAKDLKGQKLTATLVSDAGQSEATFSLD